MDDLERFWNKVDRNGPVARPELGNCWLWTKAQRNGYGAYSIKHKAVQAHRVAYELEYGEAPRLLRHKCDVRLCVRPSHLEPGTHKENSRDMLERNSSVTTLSKEAVVQARTLAADGVSLSAIVKQIGAPRHILRDAISGVSYSHIPTPVVNLEEIYRPIFYKLTEQDYEEILEALKKPYHGQNKKLAAKYGVDPSMITLIKQGKLKTIRGASQE